MTKKNWLRYGTFGSLYFTQGTILGYFTSLNTIYLMSRGLSMTDAGIFSAIALIPFVIKIFLGMLSDRVNLFGLGHRKPYIVLGLIVQIICLMLVPLVNPGETFWLFTAVAFMLQMGMALYDTCTDGLALDTTPVGEESIIQGFMVGGRALGVIAASAMAGLLADKVSWSAVFWALAVLTLVPLPFLGFVKETFAAKGRNFDWSAFAAFKQKKIIGLVGLGFVIFFVIIGVNMLVNPFFEAELGITLTTAGLMGTVWGLGVVAGSFVAPVLMRKFGQLSAVKIGLVLASVFILALNLAVSVALAPVLIFLFGLAYGSQQAIYFSLAMENTDSRIAASMYSILMAFTNIAQGAGMAVCGLLSDNIGFRWTFVVIAVLNLVAFIILPVVFGKNGNSEKQALSA